MSDAIRRVWHESGCYRVMLIIAVVYSVVRLAAHAVYLATLLHPQALPGWVDASEPMIPVDLQVYVDAAHRFTHRQPLYIEGDIGSLEELYQYAPSFALAFAPSLNLSSVAVTVVHTLAHVVAYPLVYMVWSLIFRALELHRVEKTLARTLPVWLVYSPYWSDLGYLNVYIFMALLATLLIYAIVAERPGLAAVWLVIILLIKPQWGFAVGVPLLSRRWSSLGRMLGLTAVLYLTVVAITMVIGGPAYVWEQEIAYFRFLARLSQDFAWRQPGHPFLGYNHSIRQIIYFVLGVNACTRGIATVVKMALLLPAGLVAGRWFLRLRPALSIEDPSWHKGSSLLDLAFLLYLAAFIWLDMVWELTLGIAVFTYLMAVAKQRRVRALLTTVFVPYALVDLWQLASFAIFGSDVMAPGPYFLTDPSIYAPMVMIVILVFYGILIGRLHWALQYDQDGRFRIPRRSACC